MSSTLDNDQDQQIAAYLEDRLEATAHAAFEQRLASEPALSRRLAAHLLLEVELRGQRTAPSTRLPAVRRPTGKQAVRTTTTTRRRTRLSSIRWPGVLAATATALVAALITAVALPWPAVHAAPSTIEVDVVVAAVTADAVSIDGSSTPPAVLRAGQTLRVGSRATVTLRWRGEATEATITPTSGEAVVRLGENGLILDAGAVEAKVAPRASAQAFRISAGDAVATVLGTRFRVERQGPRTLLTVTSGHVELRQGAAARVVDAGSSATADAGGVVMNAVATTGVDLERGLFARLSGDGLAGNRLRDLGPGGHHGEAQGVQVIARGLGKAVHFDGERSLVTIPHSDDFDPGDPSKPFSVAMWVRVPVGANQGHNLITKGRTAAQPGPTIALCVALSGGEHVDVYRWHDDPAHGVPKMESSSWRVGPLADNAWHHVAVVCENATFRRCYHNGIEVGTDSTPWRNDTRNRSRWTLGRFENMGFTEEYPLTGDLDDVRIYDRVLTAAEVTALAASAP